jgi:hypothetical protein
VFISVNKVVSCKQQIVRSSFLIQFAKGFLLMGGGGGEVSPLTFSVNIDKYVVIPAILLLKDLSLCSQFNATL